MPDRVQAAGIYVFRFYCQHSGDGQSCNRRPPGDVLPGCQGNSGGCARFITPFIRINCDTCTAGPSLQGNTVRLAG